MRLKICGITNKEDLVLCASYADAIGFIVGYQKSPRNISIAKAKQLMSYVPPFTNIVVVIPDFDKANSIYSLLKPGVIQLHGNETVDDVKAFREHIQCKIIKACGVTNGLEYSKHVDNEDLLKFLHRAIRAIQVFNGVELKSSSSPNGDYISSNKAKSDVLPLPNYDEGGRE